MAAADGEAAPLRSEVEVLRLRVQELERENQRLAKVASSCTCWSKCHGNVEGNDLPDDSSKCTNRKGHQRADVSHCSKRPIALKVMYFGQRFYGFSSEGQAEPTVESEIFKALERAKLLVGSRKDSCYSRCGRTDKGVSATGRVISLYLRSNLKDVGGDLLDERFDSPVWAGNINTYFGKGTYI